MNENLIVGLLALGVPLLGIGYLMLRKQTSIFRMFVAMVLIGLGYLTATGALTDIGVKIMGAVHEAAPAVAPAPESAPAPAPAP